MHILNQNFMVNTRSPASWLGKKDKIAAQCHAAIGCYNHILFDKLRFCQLQVLIEKGSCEPGQLSSPITPAFASPPLGWRP